MRVVDIGQVTKKQRKELDKKVAQGVLIKGKDFNYPIPKTAWTDEFYLNFVPTEKKHKG